MKGQSFNRERLIGSIKGVLEADENVLLGYVFGSHAEGEPTPLSDIDVAILLKDSSLRKLGELWENLAKALKVKEDRLDLVEISKASTPLKYDILRRGLKLVDRGNYENMVKSEVIKRLPEVRMLQNLMYNDGLKSLNCSLNKEILKSRRVEIIERIVTLREDILSKGEEEISSSRLYRSSMERCIHMAIEAMLDVCRHIVSAKKLGLPETYRELVKLAANAGLIPKELAGKIRRTRRLKKHTSA